MSENLIHNDTNDESNRHNLLIHGDAKDALPFLAEKYKKRIKCIYIDPPYNNGDSYKHYTDNIPNAVWLREMETIFRHLYALLLEDGSLWISIDDGNMHYLKVLADSIFGRENFIHTIVWQHRTTRENRNTFSNNHEYILVYAKQAKKFKISRNKIAGSKDIALRYKNPDNDPRGVWQSITAHVQDGHAVASQFYVIKAPNGVVHHPPQGRCWVYNKKRMDREILANNIWFGSNGCGVPRIKSFLRDDSMLVTPETLWLADDVGTTDSAKKQLLSLFSEKAVFDTPKPETLIKRIFDIATLAGDLVLDCFLGSGTTAAVAQKMDRYYIGVEREHKAYEYAIQRVRAVVAGEQSGISKEVAWKGGGEFVCINIRNDAVQFTDQPGHTFSTEESTGGQGLKVCLSHPVDYDLPSMKQLVLFERQVNLYCEPNGLILHGTYRKVCRNWIIKKAMYNLPLSKAIGEVFPDVLLVNRLLLTRRNDKPLYFNVTGCRWITKNELKEQGYPVNPRHSSTSTYLLYSLVPCEAFVSPHSKRFDNPRKGKVIKSEF
jgi:adenine-specific DNA-methyltransferase